MKRCEVDEAMETLSETLACFIAETSAGDLPSVVVEQSKRTLLNIVGCMIGGARHEAIETAIAGLREFGGPRVATFIGRGERADPLLAALINGMSSGVYSFDDTHAQAVVHPGGPVAAALLPLAETRSVSGAQFLAAFTLGAEVVCRVSKAVSVAPAKAGPHWVQTGICAGIGAAAGAAKLLDFPPERIVAAMGIAACQSGGHRALTRSMCYAFMVGNAAQSGLRAALLAERGFTSSPDPLGENGGFADVYATSANPKALTNGLGSHYEIVANTFKPYPCGVVIHPVIDACLELRGRVSEGELARIRRVHLKVAPAVLALCDCTDPRDAFEAQTSVQHWTAVALRDGKAGILQSRPDRIAASDIASLRRLVVLQADAGADRAAAEVSVELEDGRRLSEAVDRCRGSAQRPMSNEQLEAKFEAQCAGAGSCDVAALIAACWSVEKLVEAAQIAHLATGSSTRGSLAEGPGT